MDSFGFWLMLTHVGNDRVYRAKKIVKKKIDTNIKLPKTDGWGGSSVETGDKRKTFTVISSQSSYHKK